MNRIYGQYNTKGYTLLLLDEELPLGVWDTIVIENKSYDPVIVFDCPKTIAIKEHGEFKNKEIKFITRKNKGKTKKTRL